MFLNLFFAAVCFSVGHSIPILHMNLSKNNLPEGSTEKRQHWSMFLAPGGKRRSNKNWEETDNMFPDLNFVPQDIEENRNVETVDASDKDCLCKLPQRICLLQFFTVRYVQYAKCFSVIKFTTIL